MAVVAGTSGAEKFEFSAGDVVLVQWSDDRLYYAKLRRIDHATRTCSIIFEDNSRGEAKFSQIHSVDASTNDTTWIGCVICKIGTSEAPNEIVLCDECGVAFHQHCHDPSIPFQATQPEVPWRCWYCDTGTENPHMDLPGEDPFKEKGPVSREHGNSMNRKRMIKPTPTSKALHVQQKQQPRSASSFSGSSPAAKHGVHQVPIMSTGQWSSARLDGTQSPAIGYQHLGKRSKGRVESSAQELVYSIQPPALRQPQAGVAKITAVSPSISSNARSPVPKGGQQPLKMKFTIAGKTAKVSPSDKKQGAKAGDRKRKAGKGSPMMYSAVGQYAHGIPPDMQYNFQSFDLSKPTIRTMTVKSRSPPGKPSKKSASSVGPPAADQYAVTPGASGQTVRGHGQLTTAEQMRSIASASHRLLSPADNKRAVFSPSPTSTLSPVSRFQPLQAKPTPHCISGGTASKVILAPGSSGGLPPPQKNYPGVVDSSLTMSAKSPNHGKRRHSEMTGASHSKRKRPSSGKKSPSTNKLFCAQDSVDLRDCQRSSTVQTVELSAEQLLYNHHKHRHGNDQSGIKLKIVNTFIVPPTGCNFTPDHVTAVGQDNSAPNTPLHITAATSARRYFNPQVLVSEGERWIPTPDSITTSSQAVASQPGTSTKVEPPSSLQADTNLSNQFSKLPPCCRVSLFADTLPDYPTMRKPTDAVALPEMGLQELKLQFDLVFGNLVEDIRSRTPASSNLPPAASACLSAENSSSCILTSAVAAASGSSTSEQQVGGEEAGSSSPSQGSSNGAERKATHSGGDSDVQMVVAVKQEKETDAIEQTAEESEENGDKEVSPVVVTIVYDTDTPIDGKNKPDTDSEKGSVRGEKIPSHDVLLLSDQELPSNQSPNNEDLLLESIESRNTTPVVSPVILSTPASPEDVILLEDDEEATEKRETSKHV